MHWEEFDTHTLKLINGLLLCVKSRKILKKNYLLMLLIMLIPNITKLMPSLIDLMELDDPIFVKFYRNWKTLCLLMLSLFGVSNMTTKDGALLTFDLWCHTNDFSIACLFFLFHHWSFYRYLNLFYMQFIRGCKTSYKIIMRAARKKIVMRRESKQKKKKKKKKMGKNRRGVSRCILWQRRRNSWLIISLNLS